MLEDLFTNIGATIKKISKGLFYFLLVVGIVAIFIGLLNLLFCAEIANFFEVLFMSNKDVLVEGYEGVYNSRIMIGTGINLIISSFALLVIYGIGEAVECLCSMKRKFVGEEPKVEEKVQPEIVYSEPKVEVKKNSDGSWVCDKCGTTNGNHAQYCKGCGKYI